MFFLFIIYYAMFAKVKSLLAKVAPFAMVGLSGTLLEATDIASITSSVTGYAGDFVKTTIVVLAVLILITVFGLVIKKIMSIRGAVAGLGGKKRRR
jgi:hypothetical protein